MKRLALALLLLASASSAAAQAFPSTGVLDQFNRADEALTATAPWVTWPLISDNPAIISNQVGSPAAAAKGSLYEVSHGPSVEYFVTLATVPADGQAMALTWRQSTTTTTDTRYFIDVIRVAGANNDTIGFGKAVAGVYTENIGGIITLATDLANSDVIGVRMVGSDLTIYRNGTSIATRSDSAISSAGYGGLFLDNTTVRLDDFGGGTFTAGTGCRGGALRGLVGC